MNFKRIVSLLCAAVMACAVLPVIGENAANGGVSTATRALIDLLFRTNNVTLDMDASFTYDGIQFKTIRGHLVQDDFGTVIDADYFTVRPDGSSYSTFWKVHAVGDEVWSYDSHDGKYYSENYTEPSDSVVSHDGNDDTLIAMTGAAMELVDLAAPSISAVEETAGGKRITVTLQRGSVPSYLNNVADYLINEAAWRYMSLYLARDEYNDEGFPEDYDDETGTEICYEDDYALLVQYLSELKGEEVTEDDLMQMYEEDDPLINEAYAAMERMVYSTAEQYEGGWLYVSVDGTCTWYASQAEMIIAEDLRTIIYEDEDLAFIAYVKETTGETITRNDILGIYLGDNMDLWDAYFAMYTEMDNRYLDMLGEHPLGYVRADGALEAVDDIDTFYSQAASGDDVVSIAREALENKAAVRIGDSVFVFDLDAEGRITAISADVSLDFINADGSVHPVTVKLTASATAYGESKVGDFDPEAWGVPSFSEYYRLSEMGLLDEEDDETVTLPETVTLNGVTYPVFAE